MSKRVLLARQDNNGDVLLTGPAVRAVASSAAHIWYLCGPRGASAAAVLPGIDEVICSHAAWIDAHPQRVERSEVERFVDSIAALGADEGIIFTSFHQSPLPLALLLRMAGIPTIAAISVDYAGGLLDVRHHVDDDVHEVERALSLVGTLGYSLPSHDSGKLQMRLPSAVPAFAWRRYVVVHPGATMAARAAPPALNRAVVQKLADYGECVVVTGTARERELCDFVRGGHPTVYNAAGATTFEEYGAVLRDARAVISGNTAAVHVAAAVGTPVVEIFPPTIPFSRFKPWKVPYRVLGDQDIGCRGCRARMCPFEDQPCIGYVTPDDVLGALRDLLHGRTRRRPVHVEMEKV